MCYLVAKDVNKIGSVALQTTHGKNLSELKRKIMEKVGYNRIQLVTISRPSAYGEYEPYTFIYDEDEFEKIVELM